MLTDKELSKVKEILGSPCKVAIIMHRSPDGDAVGSSLGMKHYLEKFGHSVNVISPNAYPDFLKWMPGNKSVIDFEKTPAPANQVILKAELIVFLDFNSLNRIGDLDKAVKKSKAFRLVIDHHPQPENFADIAFHDVGSSSTAELVYDFINVLGDDKRIHRDIANCLYAGIMTDTGSFRFASTTAHTHDVVAGLIRHGAEPTKIHRFIDDNNRDIRLRLLGYAVLEKMKIFPDFATGFITLTQSELKRFDYKEGDTEGLVNEPISVKGIVFSALFTEQKDGEIKISFRSKDKFDVNQFARKHFDGGGHVNAAGGKSELSMDETIIQFLNLLSEYKMELKGK
ncbi:MAG TPA: bifunctional oligoribonuclease/PAP phosphatase NrnA [Bacteroidia bacterium]|nr:bifunctional oligoribonuclease/PAP phosphatase NrnA [Bacteroidia bacterium]